VNFLDNLEVMNSNIETMKIIKVEELSEIFTFPHNKILKYLEYLGSNYIFYKSNNRMTWCVFFKKEKIII
jgi:hypothetical protein